MYQLSVTVPGSTSGDYGTDTTTRPLPTGTTREGAYGVAERAYAPGTIVRLWKGSGIRATVIYQHGQHPDWTPAHNREGWL